MRVSALTLSGLVTVLGLSMAIATETEAAPSGVNLATSQIQAPIVRAGYYGDRYYDDYYRPRYYRPYYRHYSYYGYRGDCRNRYYTGGYGYRYLDLYRHRHYYTYYCRDCGYYDY